MYKTLLKNKCIMNKNIIHNKLTYLILQKLLKNPQKRYTIDSEIKKIARVRRYYAKKMSENDA